MKKYVDSWMYGVGIGMIFYLLTLLIWSVPGQTIYQMAVTVIFSGVMGLASLVYDSLPTSDFYKRIVHFSLIFACVMAMVLLNGWLDIKDMSMLALIFLEFLLIYLMISGIVYLTEKQKIKKINEKLRKK